MKSSIQKICKFKFFGEIFYFFPSFICFIFYFSTYLPKDKRKNIIIPVVAKGVHRRKFGPRVAPDFHKEAAVLIPQEQVGGA